MAVTEQRNIQGPPQGRDLSLDDLARVQSARVVVEVSDLTAELWESDAELEAFLADLRQFREASPS